LGDYTKEQQIKWFFEFLTDKVGLDPKKLYVSAFIGDEAHGIPRDDEAANIWQQAFRSKGVEAKFAKLVAKPKEMSVELKRMNVYFSMMIRKTGGCRNGGIETTPIGDPCGPDSEVFYDFGEQNHDQSYGLAHPASDSGRFLEIGNQVFIAISQARRW
jgi:alanyl-tRNA synthetase